jgi:adenylate cyclase
MTEHPVRAFLFADLSGFTALTEAHGDDDAAGVAERFIDVARGALGAHSELVKTIGDEVMIASDSALAALEVTAALYAAVDDEPLFPTIRAGLHVGPVVCRERDYYGATVNLAARVAAHARAGQVLCTGAVVDAVRDSGRFHFRSLGPIRFKNVAEPVALCELVLEDRPVPSGAVDPICRMRVDPRTAPARLTHDGCDSYFCSFPCAAAFAAAPDRRP